MVETVHADSDTTSQNPSSLHVTAPEDIKASLHELLWDQLPAYLQQAAERHGTTLGDCRIEYYREYRILFITPEGLGVDMDHRGDDLNYFQAEAMDIAYSEDEVEYIDRRKARKYDSFGKVSLFTTIWPDVVEELGGLKPGPGILQP